MSRTYHVHITLPVDVTIEVEADSEDDVLQNVTRASVAKAVAEAAPRIASRQLTVADEEIEYMLDAGWDDSTIEDVTQVEADDAAVSEHYDNAGGDL